MISAKEAREQAELNKTKKQKADIEKLIKKAVESGRDSATFTGQLSEVLKDELTQAGYEVLSGMIKW